MMCGGSRRGGTVVEHEQPQAGHESHARRHERPEDWGWHGQFGRWARVAGWLCAALLVLLNFTNRYGRSASIWLFGIAALLVLLLIRDWYRRKNAWRE
jgi:hypothetical protein